MRDSLEKKEIKKNIGPVYNALLVIGLILITMSIVGEVTNYHLGIF